MNFGKAREIRLVIADDHPIFREGVRRLEQLRFPFCSCGATVLTIEKTATCAKCGHTLVREGMHVKVGPTRPDGKPHPHAGKTGRIKKCINIYSNPHWLGPPSAMIELDSGIEPRGFIWVSMASSEVLSENASVRSSEAAATRRMNFRDLQQVRLVIADSHPGFRDGLRRLLEAEPGHKVISEASDGAEAVRLARQLKPDILLMELRMPRLNGLEALRELSAPSDTSPVRVILLTAAAERSQIVAALQLGTRGVVLKDSATQLLFKAIRTVMAGEYWVHREAVSHLPQYLRTLMQSTHDEECQKKFGLTPRELEIISAVVAGYSNREIAGYFNMGEETVKRYLINIYDKIGVSTRLELALFAVNQALPLKSIEGPPPAHSPHKPTTQ